MKEFYWVTEETRQFMEKGYLDPGQTVEERVREIADHAEAILEKTMDGAFDNFADTFYDYILDRDWETLSLK